MDLQIAQIIVIVSGVFGFLLLIASSLQIDAWSGAFNCKKHGFGGTMLAEVCDIGYCHLIGGIFGLLAAITQLISAVICFRNMRSWCNATIAVFILAIIAFSLPMAKYASDLMKLPGEGASRLAFFVVMSAMDFVYTFLAIAYTCYAGGQGVQ